MALLLLVAGCSGSGGSHVDPNESAAGNPGLGGDSSVAGKNGVGGSLSSTGGAGGSGGTTNQLPFDSSDLQLNDVSILFPVSATFNEHTGGLLGMKAKGARGELLPSALYATVGPITGQGNPSTLAAYDNLRVVGARIDPCFAALEPAADGAGCQNQLRLVVQEVVDGAIHDSALHLFYDVSREDVIELVEATAALRQSLRPKQRLGHLQPHPIMVEQGPGGSMAAGVNAAILAHAGAAKLTRVTTMSSDGGGNPTWKFAGFDIKSGTPVAMEVFGFAPGTHEQSVQDAPGSRSVHPSSGSTDAFVALLNSSSAMALSKTEQSSLLTSLRRVEDPSVYSPSTMDCVTCHLATPAMNLVVQDVLGRSSDTVPPSFKADTGIVPADELQATYELGSEMNVHAFSYLVDFSGHNAAGISQRTVNETAAIVSYLSRDVFGVTK